MGYVTITVDAFEFNRADNINNAHIHSLMYESTDKGMWAKENGVIIKITQLDNIIDPFNLQYKCRLKIVAEMSEKQEIAYILKFA